jgi:hypothetical protein
MTANPGDTCPKTGRSATACNSADHCECPDLRLQVEVLRHVLRRVASGNITPDELARELNR